MGAELGNSGLIRNYARYHGVFSSRWELMLADVTLSDAKCTKPEGPNTRPSIEDAVHPPLIIASC